MVPATKKSSFHVAVALEEMLRWLGAQGLQCLHQHMGHAQAERHLGRGRRGVQARKTRAIWRGVTDFHWS